MLTTLDGLAPPLGGYDQRPWPLPAADAWHAVNSGTSADDAALQWWPHYLHRVRDRLTSGQHATTPQRALELSARTGKPTEVIQLVLDESVTHFVAGDRGPIIARHRLGYQLTSAGVDRAGPDGAWLLPSDPDASARGLRDAITKATGAAAAVVIADSDGRADRRGATVISIGAAGIAPLRVSEYAEPDGRPRHWKGPFPHRGHGRTHRHQSHIEPWATADHQLGVPICLRR
jgi:F420-0:Gamma-glutamyl ligase